LNEWRQGVQQGWRPAVIFNATLVESGEPLLLATTNLLQKNQIEGPQRKTFAQLFPNNDIPVVTAVRLAATFPFATPAARAIADGPQYHVVDGGYYDNYGVNSLLEWLNEAFSSTPPEKRPDILIIQIRSFPAGASNPSAGNKGWFYQAEAPVSALRGTSGIPGSWFATAKPFQVLRLNGQTRAHRSVWPPLNFKATILPCPGR
jgi:hypothetical protein